MGKVVYSLSTSLDGYVAGPDDGPENGLGTRGGEHIFDWYWSGDDQIGDSGLFSPEGANRAVVQQMIAESGAMVSGRRTWDITNGWGGSHPFPGMGIVLLTHNPPETIPQGDSEIRVVTSGIEEAVAVAQELAGERTVSFAGASAGKQALAAGLVDEILVNVAPILLGGGVRMFDVFDGDSIRLEPIATIPGPHVTHLRYRVLR